MRDLIVVGGGPVGLAAGLYAARSGLDVVVVEPRSGTVDKACGEGLMPGAVLTLDELGIRPEGMPLDGIRYVDGRRRVEARFRHGPGLGVRRTTLHAALLHAVLDAGIAIDQRKVTAIVQHADHVVVDGEPARHVIGADGLHSTVRELAGLASTPRSATARRFGLRCHVETAPWTPYVEVHWAPTAEAYVTPVAPGLIGVAVLSSTRAPYADLLGLFPDLHDRLTGLTSSRVRGAGPLRQRTRHRVAGRVLLAGDAAGYVDALTGEGIAAGLAQARAAVAAIAADDAASYERAWRRLTRRHDTLTAGLLAVTSRPVLRRALVPAAAALPVVFGAAVNQLAQPA